MCCVVVFTQRPAYGVLRSLGGSEMCIRGSREGDFIPRAVSEGGLNAEGGFRGRFTYRGRFSRVTRRMSRGLFYNEGGFRGRVTYRRRIPRAV